MADQKCLNCPEPILGRTDKKFCCDNCRNNYNNRVNRDTVNIVRNINNGLRRNRKLLESYISKKTVPVQSLIEKGFDFNIHTSAAQTKSGKTYNYCYDYGYLRIDEKSVLVVKKFQ